MTITDEILNAIEIAYIKEKTEKLYAVNQEVLKTITKHDKYANGAMIGQFTKIIYDEIEGPSFIFHTMKNQKEILRND